MRTPCNKPERFSVEFEDASFDTLAVSENDKIHFLGAKLADALSKIVQGDLSWRLLVMSDTLPKHCLVLGRYQILPMIYREFEKRLPQTNCMSFSHLEKIK